MKFLIVLAIAFACLTQESNAQHITKDSLPASPQIKHSSKGFEISSADNNYLIQIAARLQFRFATPADQDPATFDDFATEKKNIFKVNRARLKIGGHAYKPWLKYYFEYELSQSNLLDFRVMVEKYKWLSLKVGQWKTDYNRERVISSGEQQMVERSLITKPFTLDRQQGIELYGHLAGKGAANFNYWVSVLTGMGRGSRTNDDEHLMYVARLQWNPLGREVEMSGSDEERTEKPALLIAVAGVTNRSMYTRFSQAGGGSLEGYPGTAAGQYRVNQAMIETAFKYKGFSWQHETHFKEINDKILNTTTNLTGSYYQAGYFFNEVIPSIPKDLELAFRYAVYRPDNSQPNNRQQEYSTALNYFFSGHKNKLTMEYAIVAFQQDVVNQAARNRFRLQWDISF